MKKLLPVALIFAACSVNPDNTTKDTLVKATVIPQRIDSSENTPEYVSKKDITLDLSYNAIACSCAQWSDTKTVSDTAAKVYYYLEPANDKLIDAEKLWDGEHLPLQIQVTGRIISLAGYPAGYDRERSKGGEPGIVLRYTQIKVLKNGLKKG